jgi:hypothetical protein
MLTRQAEVERSFMLLFIGLIPEILSFKLMEGAQPRG